MATQGSLVTFSGVDPNLATAIFAKSAEQSAERTARVQAGSNERIAAIGAQSAKETTQMTTQAQVDIAEKEVEAAIKNVLAQEAGAKERTLIGAQSSEKIAETTSQAQLLSTYLTNLSNERITGMTTESNEKVNTEQVQAMLMKAGMDNQTAYAISQAQNLSNTQIARLDAMTKEKVAGIEATTAQTIAAGQLWSGEQDRVLNLKLEDMRISAQKEANDLSIKLTEAANNKDIELYDKYAQLTMETQEKDRINNLSVNALNLITQLKMAQQLAVSEDKKQSVALSMMKAIQGSTATTGVVNALGSNIVQTTYNDPELQQQLEAITTGIVDENPIKGITTNTAKEAYDWNRSLTTKLNNILTEKTQGRMNSFDLPQDEAGLAKLKPEDVLTAQLILTSVSEQLEAKSQGITLEEKQAQWAKDHSDYINYVGDTDSLNSWIASENPMALWQFWKSPATKYKEKQVGSDIANRAIVDRTADAMKLLVTKWNNVTTSKSSKAQSVIQASNDLAGNGAASLLTRAYEATSDTSKLKSGDTLTYNDIDFNKMIAWLQSTVIGLAQSPQGQSNTKLTELLKSLGALQ